MFCSYQECHILHESVHVNDGGGERRRQMFQQQNPPPGESGDNPQQNDHLSWHRGLPGAIQAAADDLVQGTVVRKGNEILGLGVGSVARSCVIGPCDSVRSARRLNGEAPSRQTPHTCGYLRWRRATGETTPASCSTDPGWCGGQRSSRSQVGRKSEHPLFAFQKMQNCVEEESIHISAGWPVSGIHHAFVKKIQFL